MPGSQFRYVGRFAPTPSGPLHFGSIIAALGSYLDARHNGGQWLLRIDDLDTPRVQPGAVDKILFALEALGLHWDNSILYQSRRVALYREAEDRLARRNMLFPCYCSRDRIKGKPYPGTCRDKRLEPARQHAIRIKTTAGVYTLHDRVQAEYSLELHKEVGDFIIRRADGLYAYHLATVLDDACQNISHVVRGADLMESSLRQIYLQQQLGLSSPSYAHLPVAVDQSGRKISKQLGASAVLLRNRPSTILFNCLQFLGQKPEKGLMLAPVDTAIQWALENWKLSAVPERSAIAVPGEFC